MKRCIEKVNAQRGKQLWDKLTPDYKAFMSRVDHVIQERKEIFMRTGAPGPIEDLNEHVERLLSGQTEDPKISVVWRMKAEILGFESGEYPEWMIEHRKRTPIIAIASTVDNSAATASKVDDSAEVTGKAPMPKKKKNKKRSRKARSKNQILSQLFEQTTAFPTLSPTMSQDLDPIANLAAMSDLTLHSGTKEEESSAIVDGVKDLTTAFYPTHNPETMHKGTEEAVDDLKNMIAAAYPNLCLDTIPKGTCKTVEDLKNLIAVAGPNMHPDTMNKDTCATVDDDENVTAVTDPYLHPDKIYKHACGAVEAVKKYNFQDPLVQTDIKILEEFIQLDKKEREGMDTGLVDICNRRLIGIYACHATAMRDALVGGYKHLIPAEIMECMTLIEMSRDLPEINPAIIAPRAQWEARVKSFFDENPAAKERFEYAKEPIAKYIGHNKPANGWKTGRMPFVLSTFVQDQKKILEFLEKENVQILPNDNERKQRKLRKFPKDFFEPDKVLKYRDVARKATQEPELYFRSQTICEYINERCKKDQARIDARKAAEGITLKGACLKPENFKVLKELEEKYYKK